VVEPLDKRRAIGGNDAIDISKIAAIDKTFKK
jgi:hypothetical protein